MSFQGSFATSTVIDFNFTTVGITGAPQTLSGSPAISVYKSNSTSPSTAGVALTADFNSTTGLNHVRVDTSADGTFYATANEFSVVITTGTVGGVSVVGYVVGNFVLNNAPAGSLTAAQIATGVWQDTTSGDFTVSGSIGKGLFTSGNAPGQSNGLLLSTTLMPEGYTTLNTGSTYRLNAVLWDIHQRLYSRSVASTTETVFQQDNATTAHTITLDSASAPTSAKQAT